MQNFERRSEQRPNTAMKVTPLSCQLVLGKDRFDLEVVNYHYRGACLKTKDKRFPLRLKGAYLIFKIGQKEIRDRIQFRIIWENIDELGIFGVEFTQESVFVLQRSTRFQSHSINIPIVSSQDPLDPNRIIYFKVQNSSSTGMLLSTSLSNKHILPGMELKTAILEIAGIGKTDVELFIENSRPGDNQTILYGVSVKGNGHNYNTLMAKYLSNLGQLSGEEDRLEQLEKNNFLHKSLHRHLTIRHITSEKEYNEVKKLRFKGYNKVGKVSKETTWHDMGDGLDKEGYILGAYLGGQIVGSCEIRLQRTHGLRLSQKLDVLQIPGVRSDNLCEINKLVVHTSAKHSDIVLGIFQKIHAFGMLNGRPDGLIAAEPNLIPLYERLGFHKTAQKIPHSVRSDIELTLMVINSEAYADADGMNTFSWAMAFEETQKFFDEIGVHKTHEMSMRQKIEKQITRFLFKSGILNRKKRNRKSNQSIKVETVLTDDLKNTYKSSETHRKNFLDPRWTQPHINATIFFPYLLESMSLIGPERTHKILLDFGFEESYFKKTSNWISIDFFNTFIEKYCEFGDPYILNKKAGYRSVTPEVLGANYYIIKNFLNPGTTFKAFEKLLPKFNKTRYFQVIDSGHRHAKIRITTPDKSLLPKHPSAKENWFAIIEAYCELMTGKHATINSIKSSFDGQEYCEFSVQWENQLFSPRRILGYSLFSYLVFLGFDYLDGAAVANPSEWLGGMCLALIATYSSYKFVTYRKRYHDVLESMDSLEREADEKYSELQQSKSTLEKSYQEGRLLETIHRDIQRSEDLKYILESALESICKNFSFKRAFTMIRDEDAKMLRTAAIFDEDSRPDSPAFEELWKFKIDISVQRDNPLVISSVFHSGQSLLISNIENHMSQFNPSSQKLLKSFKASGFAAVPIPSEHKTWGVLIADKGQSKEIITRRDLVALQRVAQSIGLALDKKAKLDQEIKIRQIFQKYVPLNIVESTLAMKDPHLGGEQKVVTCLFMDIRNFTKLSGKFPAEVLIELLNEVFNLLHSHVQPTQGVIDKFLGDGALVTWGAVPGTDCSSAAILASIRLFLDNLKLYNQKNLTKGIPPIEVGIGIHRGEVIAGNVGSAERMEFTVIGPSVNIASRLEQLTKVYRTQLVISESFIILKDLDQQWRFVQDTQIRGLEQGINIAFLAEDHHNSERGSAA